MAESTTVSTMISLIRRKTDQENSTFVTDDELIEFIDLSYKELYNKLIEANSTYFLTSTQISVVGGQDIYALPTDFYKVQGVDVNVSGDRAISARPFNFEERNRKNYNGYYANSFGYIIRGDSIQFLPTPFGSQNVVLWYIPLPQTITATTDTINTVNGGFRWIVADVCIMVATKEESDTTSFETEKMRHEENIRKSFAIRDEGMAQRVTDINDINDYYFDGYGGVL